MFCNPIMYVHVICSIKMYSFLNIAQFIMFFILPLSGINVIQRFYNMDMLLLCLLYLTHYTTIHIATQIVHNTVCISHFRSLT